MKEAEVDSTQNYIISCYEGYSSIITLKLGTGFLECPFTSLKKEKKVSIRSGHVRYELRNLGVEIHLLYSCTIFL